MLQGKDHISFWFVAAVCVSWTLQNIGCGMSYRVQVHLRWNKRGTEMKSVDGHCGTEMKVFTDWTLCWKIFGYGKFQYTGGKHVLLFQQWVGETASTSCFWKLFDPKQACETIDHPGSGLHLVRFLPAWFWKLLPGKHYIRRRTKFNKCQSCKISKLTCWCVSLCAQFL